MSGDPWASDTPGLCRLPSGRLVRGRGLLKPLPPGPTAEFGLYLQGADPGPMPWGSRWIRWPDFRLPTDRKGLRPVLEDLLERAGRERVEIACSGGHGRTGTALACLAVLDGVPGQEAVAYVREHYSPRAVETPCQRRFVSRF